MREENDLNLPVLTGPQKPVSIRSIDEIIGWIDENYVLFFDRDVYEKQKARFSVNVKFVL
jgi:hypothetical protein